ncbi:uncharacterized protein LOC122245497, partial [Penaeus japonicus]|uniref:uncharacterized protein LOC122245497 n=1 Tax=Penaeus japonicus TaxID=27405 RepID=UPI001C7145ED
CSFEIQLFNFFKEDLRREFTFDQEIQTKVRAFLAKVLQKRPSDNNRTPSPVLVGFHVRRTDYVRHMINFGAKLPEDKYFTRALGRTNEGSRATWPSWSLRTTWRSPGKDSLTIAMCFSPKGMLRAVVEKLELTESGRLILSE